MPGHRLFCLLLIVSCRSPGLVGRLCVGEDCLASAPAPGCDRAPCDAGPCNDAECTASEPAPCPDGVCISTSTPPTAADDAGTPAPPPDPSAPAECDADAGSCDAPSCETGPCRAGPCMNCTPDPGCNQAFPVCPGCSSDADCGFGEARRCDVSAGRCVECLEAAHCGGYEPHCVAGDCEACRDDADCRGPGLTHCRNGDCSF